MPRPRKTDRPYEFHCSIPESVREAVSRQLYSSIEGKVPHGAMSNLITQLLSNWVEAQEEQLE